MKVLFVELTVTKQVFCIAVSPQINDLLNTAITSVKQLTDVVGAKYKIVLMLKWLVAKTQGSFEQIRSCLNSVIALVFLFSNSHHVLSDSHK